MKDQAKLEEAFPEPSSTVSEQAAVPIIICTSIRANPCSIVMDAAMRPQAPTD
jgi:hypothetical protein